MVRTLSPGRKGARQGCKVRLGNPFFSPQAMHIRDSDYNYKQISIDAELWPHLEPLPRRARDDELPLYITIRRRRHEPMADVRPEPRV